MRTDFLCCSVLRATSGPRVKLAGFAWFYVVPVFFSPFSIAITSLGEERASPDQCFLYFRSICVSLVLSVFASS